MSKPRGERFDVRATSFLQCEFRVPAGHSIAQAFANLRAYHICDHIPLFAMSDIRGSVVAFLQRTKAKFDYYAGGQFLKKPRSKKEKHQREEEEKEVINILYAFWKIFNFLSDPCR